MKRAVEGKVNGAGEIESRAEQSREMIFGLVCYFFYLVCSDSVINDQCLFAVLYNCTTVAGGRKNCTGLIVKITGDAW